LVERGGDAARQKDLVDLEVEAEPDSDYHPAMNGPDRQVIQASPNVGQYRWRSPSRDAGITAGSMFVAVVIAVSSVTKVGGQQVHAIQEGSLR
jgi:hypothetical protein